MAGFGVDVGQLGSLADKVSGIGDSLGGAAKSMSSALSGGEDFGHTDLNKAVSQLSSLVSDNLKTVSTTTGQMTDTLRSTASSYSNVDQSNSDSLAKTMNGGTSGGTGAQGSGDSGQPGGVTGGGTSGSSGGGSVEGGSGNSGTALIPSAN